MKIAILLPSLYLHHRYSPVSVAENQLRMLISHGYQPVLLLKEECKGSYKNLEGVEYRRCLPCFESHSYKKYSLRKEDRPWLKKSIKALYHNLKDVDLAVTHDIIYLDDYFVYNLAMREVAKRLPRIYWLHWIHSPTSKKSPIWKRMKRSRLVIPNHEHKKRTAKAFGCPLDEVKTVHHCLDIDSYPLHPLTKELIDSFDLLNADIVQLYPVDARRLSNKQIYIVIELFARLKKRGKKVRLIIANPRCIDDGCRAEAEAWLFYALNKGLTREEIFFTSKFQVPRWEMGIPREVVIELFHYVTNLFIFPSSYESFSLVTQEAANGGNLLVLNEDLSFLKKLIGKDNALFCRFGKFTVKGKFCRMDPRKRDRQLSHIIDKIINKFDQEMCLKAKQRVRQRFNSKWIFKNQFEPLLRGF